MKITEYGMDDLKRARELQQECLDLHLPSPPVVLWTADVTVNEEITERIIAKANSYVRNAYNIMAWDVGAAAINTDSSTIFGDGYLNIREIAGGIFGMSSNVGRGNYNGKINMGFQNPPSPESLNSYAPDATPANFKNISTTAISFFDSTSRKLITNLTGIFKNNATFTEKITSSNLIVDKSPSLTYLIIRDIFPAIEIPEGATLSFTYTTEVAYPNPS